jgi:hypothetical protein
VLDVDQRYLLPDPGDHGLGTTVEAVEAAGVVHLSHGWIQQNQVKKVKFTTRNPVLPLLTSVPGAFHRRRQYREQHNVRSNGQLF